MQAVCLPRMPWDLCTQWISFTFSLTFKPFRIIILSISVSRYSYGPTKVFWWLYTFFQDASHPCIFNRYWSGLSCMWTVLFWLRAFLEFKTKRGMQAHCSSVPFFPVFLVLNLCCWLHFKSSKIVHWENL